MVIYMKRRVGCICLFLLFLGSIFSAGSVTIIDSNDSRYQRSIQIDQSDKDEQHTYIPLMRLDPQTLVKWESEYLNAEKAYIDPSLNEVVQKTDNYSILDLLKYVPSERDQGRCSNCWAWPSTGVLSIALFVQEGVYERLSVQYINSCGVKIGSDCCEGGNLEIFTRFYRNTDMAIPWSNTNAEWRDKYAQCLTDCETISTEPNYPIAAIRTQTIETHEIPEDQAIENIKNILHQEKGIYFSWILPDMEYRNDFSDFWDDYSEDYVYQLDWACGREYLDDGGGHAVLCVGYNDEEGTENDYWIMLNSWGTPRWRPNGLFAINMHMDYDCTALYSNSEIYSFNWQTLNITFGSADEAPDPPKIQGPESGKAKMEYTYLFSTVDTQYDDVYFSVDWGDGTIDEWMGPVAYGGEIELSHTWERRGDYVIRAKAKDVNGAESFASTLEISMPRTRSYQFNGEENIPFLFQLLKMIRSLSF